MYGWDGWGGGFQWLSGDKPTVKGKIPSMYVTNGGYLSAEMAVVGSYGGSSW